MECREAKKLVPLFLRGKLDGLDLDAFVDHVIACRVCETCLLAMPEGSEG